MYPPCSFEENAGLAAYTTFKLGGQCRYLLFPTNTSELEAAISWIQQAKMPFFIIGGGSNILIGDDFFDGIVLNTTRLCETTTDADQSLLRVGSGISAHRTVEIAMENGLSGLEFSYGLPGSIGGAVVMNARVYGHEMSEFVQSVNAVNLDGKCHSFSNQDIGYAYKRSIFQDSDWVISVITFQLEKKDKDLILKEMNEIYQKRKDAHHYDYPSAGCIFKNDYELGTPSGKLIDDAGGKGLSEGHARVWEEHANYIIHDGNAKSKDIYKLIRRVEHLLWEKNHIRLEREVKLLGNFGDFVVARGLESI